MSDFFQGRKEMQEDTMKSHGVPRLVHLQIKSKKKAKKKSKINQDSQDVTAFFDSSEEDLSPEESSDEESTSDSASDSDDDDWSCYYIRKWYEKGDVHTYTRSRNLSEEEKLYAVIRSQLQENLRDDDIQSDEEIEQDHINTIMNLYNPEADWNDIISLLLESGWGN